MAAIWGTGFELQTTTVGVEWRTSTNGAPAIETGEPITGSASIRFNNAAAAENIQQIVASAQGVRFYQIWFKLKVTPAMDGVALTRINNGSNGKIEVKMRNVANNNKLQLFNVEDNAQIGSDSGTITADTIYILELKIDSTTLASTTAEARLYTPADRTTLLWNPSGTANLAADPNRWVLGSAADTTFDIIYDNVLCWDNSGSYMNDWGGGWEVTILRPSGASSAAWSRGGADSGANWSQTEELTPNGATDYVESNTANQVDKYALDNTPSYLESTDIIGGVFVGSQFAISATTGADPDFEVGLDISGTVDYSADLSGAGATAYVTYQTGNNGIWPSLGNDSNYEQPGGSSAWTKSALDSALVAIKETVTDTHFIRVSALWVYVVHKPAPAVSIPVLYHHLQQQGIG
jgi:hypothetical protein